MGIMQLTLILGIIILALCGQAGFAGFLGAVLVISML